MANTTPTCFNLLLYYLQHGHAPWWQPAPLPMAALAGAIRTASRPQLSVLRQFIAQHTREPAVQRRVAALAGFGTLHELLPATRLGRRRRQLVGPALVALDHLFALPTAGPARPAEEADGEISAAAPLLPTQAVNTPVLTTLLPMQRPVYSERLPQLLRTVWFARTVGGQAPAATGLSELRRQATASGLGWRGVMRCVGHLLRWQPGLSADPFFELLLIATLAHKRVRWPRRSLVHPPAVGAPLLTQSAEMSWHALEHYLQTGNALPGSDLLAALALLGLSDNAALLPRLRAYLGSATCQGRLAALVPAPHFPTFLQKVFPRSGRSLAGIAHDWLRLQSHGLMAGTTPTGLWAEVLAMAATPDPAGARPRRLVQRLLQTVATPAHQAQAVHELLHTMARQPTGWRSALAPLLATQLPPPPRTARRPPQPAGPPPEAAKSPTEPAYINNAGLVLLWPFLTPLFERLGYLELRQLKSPVLADRAMHLLHFLATGEENPAEHLLVINKLLCGVPAAHPTPRELPLTTAEKTTCEDLLQAVIGQWSALKSTSIAGLRQTFLQRPGKLHWQAERVTLTVQNQTVDILVDRLPWSISLIKLPWVALPCYVTWR